MDDFNMRVSIYFVLLPILPYFKLPMLHLFLFCTITFAMLQLGWAKANDTNEDGSTFGASVVTVFSACFICVMYGFSVEKFDRKVFVENVRAKKEKEAAQGELARSDELLLQILPKSIFERMKSGGTSFSEHFDSCTVVFASVNGFEEQTDHLPALEIVRRLNCIFSAFDEITNNFRVEKIKTIAESYMFVSGLPEKVPN
jgi:hypothetical protein